MRRQRVESNVSVDDWRMRIDNWSIGVLGEEAPTYAVVEAPEGGHIRIEALVAGVWLPACESNVECLP